MKTKTCRKCGQVKDIYSFRKNGRGSSLDCMLCIELHKENAKKEVINIRNKVFFSPKYFLRKDQIVLNASSSNGIKNISNSYVSKLIGISLFNNTKDLIELKREQLQLRRLTKQLNQVIKDAQK